MISGRVRLQARADWEGVTVLIDGTPVGETSTDGTFKIVAPQSSTRLEAHREGCLPSRLDLPAPLGPELHVRETLLIAGDTFQDNRVGVLDLSLVLAAQGRCAGGPNYQSFLDLDGSGCIDLEDARIVNANFGHLGPTAWSPVPDRR